MATQQQQGKSQGKSQGKGNVLAGIPAQELEAQNRYWREHFKAEPYYAQGMEFDAYAPAYRLGIAARGEYPEKQFGDVEDRLRTQYEAGPQAQRTLDWSKAKQAVQAAWERTGQALHGGDAGKPSQH